MSTHKINTQWDVCRRFEITFSHFLLTFKFEKKKTCSQNSALKILPLHSQVLFCCLVRSDPGIKALPANIQFTMTFVTLRELWSICRVSKPFAHSGYKENIPPKKKKIQLPSNSRWRVHEVLLQRQKESTIMSPLLSAWGFKRISERIPITAVWGYMMADFLNVKLLCSLSGLMEIKVAHSNQGSHQRIQSTAQTFTVMALKL